MEIGSQVQRQKGVWLQDQLVTQGWSRPWWSNGAEWKGHCSMDKSYSRDNKCDLPQEITLTKRFDTSMSTLYHLGL